MAGDPRGFSPGAVTCIRKGPQVLDSVADPPGTTYLPWSLWSFTPSLPLATLSLGVYPSTPLHGTKCPGPLRPTISTPWH